MELFLLSRPFLSPKVVGGSPVHRQLRDLLVQVEAATHERISDIWATISALDGVQNMTTSFVLDSVVHKR